MDAERDTSRTTAAVLHRMSIFLKHYSFTKTASSIICNLMTENFALEVNGFRSIKTQDSIKRQYSIKLMSKTGNYSTFTALGSLLSL